MPKKHSVNEDSGENAEDSKLFRADEPEVSEDEDDEDDENYPEDEEATDRSPEQSQILTPTNRLSPFTQRGSKKQSPTVKDKIPYCSKSLGMPSERNEEQSNSIFIFCVCGIGALVIAMIVAGYLSTAGSPTEVAKTSDERLRLFKIDLKSMEKKFPRQQARDWRYIMAGMADIMRPSYKPWIFVLFSNDTQAVECLAELLGSISAKALDSRKHLVLRPQDMGRDYGDTIHRFKRQINEQKAVVVHDILSIDPGAIQAFHSMCDRETPLVEEAIYILTIIVNDYNSSQRAEEFIEDRLTERFINKVSEDKLQPLITRITDGPIILVEPENIPTPCTL